MHLARLGGPRKQLQRLGQCQEEQSKPTIPGIDFKSFAPFLPWPVRNAQKDVGLPDGGFRINKLTDLGHALRHFILILHLGYNTTFSAHSNLRHNPILLASSSDFPTYILGFSA